MSNWRWELLGDVLHDPGHGEIGLVVEAEEFADGVFAAEILLGRPLGQDDGVGPGQGGLWISGDERKGEDLEDRGVGVEQARFIEAPVGVFDQSLGQGLDPDDGVYFGVILGQGRPEGHLRGRDDDLALLELSRRSRPGKSGRRSHGTGRSSIS